MPLKKCQSTQCNSNNEGRFRRPNAAKGIPSKKNTCNAMVAPPENAAKKGYAENMLRPSLNAGEMAGWYSEIAQNARSLGKCWKSGLAAMRFMEIGWTRYSVAGLQWVVRREEGFSCIRRVRPRPRRRHRDCASGVRCILLALSRLVRCSPRGRRQPCWKIGVW